MGSGSLSLSFAHPAPLAIAESGSLRAVLALRSHGFLSCPTVCGVGGASCAARHPFAGGAT
jgi:hypothetical protein